MISWITSGARESDFRTVFWPRSIRRAISTSPSRVSSGTVPISRRYMPHRVVDLLADSGGQLEIEQLLGLFELLLEILGLFEDFDSRDVQTRQHVFEVGAAGQIAGQNFADLIVEDVALFLAHLYETLKPSNLSSIATEAPSLLAERRIHDIVHQARRPISNLDTHARALASRSIACSSAASRSASFQSPARSASLIRRFRLAAPMLPAPTAAGSAIAAANSSSDTSTSSSQRRVRQQLLVLLFQARVQRLKSSRLPPASSAKIA